MLSDPGKMKKNIQSCNPCYCFPVGQRGVGMIELLIAMLVFAVGVLGMASMQLAAKRNLYESTQRSIATGLNRDILERMRSNPHRLNLYVVDKMSTVTAASRDCAFNSCDPNELAAYDLMDWSVLLNGQNELVTIDGGTTIASGGLVKSLACITNDEGSVRVAIAWKGASEMLDPNEPCGKDDIFYTGSAAGMSYRRAQTMTSYIPEG